MPARHDITLVDHERRHLSAFPSTFHPSEPPEVWSQPRHHVLKPAPQTALTPAPSSTTGPKGFSRISTPPTPPFCTRSDKYSACAIRRGSIVASHRCSPGNPGGLQECSRVGLSAQFSPQHSLPLHRAICPFVVSLRQRWQPSMPAKPSWMADLR
jgi:hypothetical protein